MSAVVASGHCLQLNAWSFNGLSGASSATFSPCGTYRYDLRRTWDPKGQLLIVIGANPSVADAFREDHTVRKLITWARNWGCGGLCVQNCFAYRSTDPQGLYIASDPIGPENDATIEATLEAHRNARLLLAWGIHGAFRNRGERVFRMAKEIHGSPECFGVVANGEPMHPLRLAYKTAPRPYERGTR